MEELVLQRGRNQIAATVYGKSKYGIVLCPPHPQHGGSREDSRLVEIARKLASSDMTALCLDYSAYTGGTEEVKDVLFTLEYMSQAWQSMGLVGYSYGAVVASQAASQFPKLKGLVLMSPLKKVNGLQFDLNSECKKLFIYGVHDNMITKDIDEIYDLSRGEKQRLSLNTDHFYMGHEGEVAQAVVNFFTG